MEMDQMLGEFEKNLTKEGRGRKGIETHNCEFVLGLTIGIGKK